MKTQRLIAIEKERERENDHFGEILYFLICNDETDRFGTPAVINFDVVKTSKEFRL